MPQKKILTTALLLFVAASVVKLGAKHFLAEEARPASSTDAALDAAANRAAVKGDAVVVYFFHTRERCKTCTTIETCSHEAVEREFREELADGRIAWRKINLDAPGNRHFDDEYHLGDVPSIVLVRFRDGAAGDWKNLDEVTAMAADGAEAVLREYVVRELHRFVDAK
jgi:hypothetical protein